MTSSAVSVNTATTVLCSSMLNNRRKGNSTHSASLLASLKANSASLSAGLLRNKPTSQSLSMEARGPRLSISATKTRDDITFDFDSYMQQKKNDVDQALDEAVLLREPLTVTEAMRYSLLIGENRIRSLLCIAACELVGGEETTAMPAACAVEMIHTVLSIRDDLCTNNSNIHQGKPTVPKMFGENVAVLAGTALASLAFEHIAEATAGVSPHQVVHAVTELAKSTGPEGALGRRVIDIGSAGMSDVGLEQHENVHIHKTGLLLESSVVVGAILGGGTDEQVEILRKYARCVGLLYQGADNMLDVTRTSEQIHKVKHPKLVGLTTSGDISEKLMRKATEQLSGFDQEKARPLISIANFIATG